MSAQREMNRACSPALNSSSSKTLKAANFLGSTPCRPRICTVALEKPHWGTSGVPFIKSTTGDEAMALSMAVRVSSERRRMWAALRRVGWGLKADNVGRVRAVYGGVLNSGQLAHPTRVAGVRVKSIVGATSDGSTWQGREVGYPCK